MNSRKVDLAYDGVLLGQNPNRFLVLVRKFEVSSEH